MVCDTAALLRTRHRGGKAMLFEGAQGTMLDIDHGTYPVRHLFERRRRRRRRAPASRRPASTA